MRYLLQRVTNATVTIDGNETRSIGPGLLVYVSIGEDTVDNYQQQIDTFVQKLPRLQLFSDQSGKITQSLTDVDGEVMIVSNFTLHGRNKKGSQIDFSQAADYEQAEKIYKYLIEQLGAHQIPFKAGQFGAKMHVNSTVDGPVNIVL